MDDKREDVWDLVLDQLRAQGVDLEQLACAPGASRGPLKVVCVAANLRESVDELGAASRDQVVMVRVDADTRRALDAWVETGAVKSRSEAAALFIREGLKLRHAELDELKDALRGVNDAKRELRDKARRVLGAVDENN